ERAVRSSAHAPHEQREIGLEPDRDALMLDHFAGCLVDVGAAAGRQHRCTAVKKPGNHLALAVAEIGLAVVGEYLRDGLTRRRLDLVIGIDERKLELFGKPPS